MSLCHLIKGLLTLSLHHCLKIKEGLVGKQPGTAFPDQLPGDFLHKETFKMIYANLTSRLKLLRGSLVCTHSLSRHALSLYLCLTWKDLSPKQGKAKGKGPFGQIFAEGLCLKERFAGPVEQQQLLSHLFVFFKKDIDYLLDL